MAVKDLTIVMEPRPGVLASLGESLGSARVNVEGFCGFPAEGQAIGHLLVDDPGTAREALERPGAQVTDERDVLVLDLLNRAGALGQTARKLADAGLNIELVYLASNNRVVVGMDDLDKTTAALG